MATLVADLFTDDIGINILSFLDHKTEIKLCILKAVYYILLMLIMIYFVVLVNQIIRYIGHVRI